MKKIVFLIAVIACTLPSFAQKINVAVYAPQKTNEIFDKSTTDFIVGEFVSNISKSNQYIAVNRSNEFLQAISSEHSFERSGMVDEQEIAQLGKEKGAKLICVVIFRNVLGEKTIEARMLDVEGAHVITSDLRDASNFKDVNQIKSTVAVIVTTLLTNTTSENNQGSKSTRLASANERLYYVNGRVQGYSDGEMISLNHQEVLKRMVNNPEALSLYNEGWSLIQDHEGPLIASVLGFMVIGVPSAILAPLFYTHIIGTYEYSVLTGSIFAGIAAIFTTWFAVELSLNSSAKNKIKKAVNKYNERTTYMTIGVSPDRLGLVFNF